MSARELTLLSISSALVGALTSIALLRLISSNKSSRNNAKMDESSSSLPNGNDCDDASFSKCDPFDPSKRRGYITWDDYFMSIAFLSAERSKDPNRQSGIGYNGFPRGCSDDKLPWAKKSARGDPLETKFPEMMRKVPILAHILKSMRNMGSRKDIRYVVHAEVNAILNTNHASAAGQKLYVTMFPCNECAKIIIQMENADHAYVASHRLLSMAGIKVRRHQPEMDKILIEFQEP